MTIIHFNDRNKAAQSSDDEPQNLILSFDEFQTVTDDRIALARFTTVAQRLINDGIDPNTVYHAMYRAGAFMACQCPEHYQNFTASVHDEMTRAGTDLCEERLSHAL